MIRSIVIILCITALLLSADRLNAQNAELGVIIGEPTGVSAKFWTSNRSAVDLGVAWSLGDSGNMHVHANYLIHFWIDSGTAFYFGLGGRIRQNEDLELAARIPLGLQFNIARRLSIFFELAPTLPLLPETTSSFATNGGAGLRFRF